LNPAPSGDVTHNFLFFFVAMVRANRSSIKSDLRNGPIFSLLSQTAMLMSIFRKLFIYSANDVKHRGRLRCVSVHTPRDSISLLNYARQPKILCPASTKLAQFFCYKSMLLNSFSIKLQLKKSSPDLVRATTLTSFRF
jgi:hypothetical protein